MPQTSKEILEIIRMAKNDKSSIEIMGAGSKRRWGRPDQASMPMDLSHLSGITLYEPEELVLSAAAGTSMQEIYHALESQNQQLAFEPPDFSPLYGGKPNVGTLGGVIATNLSGPRRFQVGAARDYFLGFEAISGIGKQFKSGGRVMKNVTGFDLPKLLAGSFGTLAAMVSVTVKVLPSPEQIRTVMVFGLNNKVAIQALSEILKGPFEVNGAIHLPSDISIESSIPYVSSVSSSVTAVRLEGLIPSVDERCHKIRSLWEEYGEVEELHDMNSSQFWSEIRDITVLLNNKADQIWRISVPSSEGPVVVSRIRSQIKCKVFFDWGGGLVWLATDGELIQASEVIRGALGPLGGHATLIRGSQKIRIACDVFHPQSDVLHRLTKNLKANFDPDGILNPGRMYEGI
jgi:glycolate oxidase FAD binding subunit